MDDKKFDTKEMSDNLKALRKCRKCETLLFLLIVFPTAVMLVYSFIAIFSPAFSGFGIIIGVVLRILYVVMAFAGLYCKKDHWAIAAPIANAIVFVMNVGGSGSMLPGAIEAVPCMIAIPAAAVTLLNNRIYRHLEQQEGFPYFSVLIETRKNDSVKFSERDPFAAAAEERRKTATDKMDDLF